jgi:glucose/arabinose dehydrogenase
MAVVETTAFADWSGDLLLGAMNGPKGQKIVHVDITWDGRVAKTTDLLTDLTIPFRDVISTPDAIYLATADLDGAVYRLEKAN